MVFCIPGTRIGSVKDYSAGHGTFTRNGIIYASIVGESLLTSSNDIKTISVSPSTPKTASRSGSGSVVPEIGSIILGKVLRINSQKAVVAIISVGDKPCTFSLSDSASLQGAFQGIIRTQDVRKTEIDKVSIYKSFRPGDIVRAQVVSFGDSRSFYLSTAENELGVLLATSEAGYTMIPISWEEMMCPVSNTVEPRKCAKPVV